MCIGLFKVVEQTENLFVDVALSLHLPLYYRYKVPKEFQTKILVGQRVVVQFRSRIYSAIVVKIANVPPEYGIVKPILEIVDEEPIVTLQQIDFFKWVADYYIAYIGDVLTAALPSSFRLKSETMVMVSPYFSGDITQLKDKEIELFNLVNSVGKLKLEDIKSNIEKKDIIKIIYRLIKKDVLITDEELYNRYLPKKETYLAINPVYKDKEHLKTLLDELDKSKKTQNQALLLVKFLSLLQSRDIVKKSELEPINNSTLNTLIKKEIIIKKSLNASRLKYRQAISSTEDIILNEEQQKAYEDIEHLWNKQPITLLHGVTGSGKTEIYIKLIDKVLRQGGQVLYLIPEIAINMQLIKRLEKYFGNQIAVYNSKYSTVERAEVWLRTKTSNRQQKFNIILGSRSSIFLPFTDLQLIIVDEEHDTSYKQNEPVPHYNARDCALYLSKIFKAKTILGSATPLIESYKNSQEGKYQLVELKSQYFALPLPKIELVDMRQQSNRNSINSILSVQLCKAIDDALNNKQQVIIFINRRGYAPHIVCNVCGYIPKCPNCDVSLVLHKDKRALECHYCGYQIDALAYCPECHSHSMHLVGSGTEKIEEQLQIQFPQAKIKRMDLDSTRKKDSYTQIIDDFANHRTDILCGTQIITKGLDFDNVAVVGVIGSDSLLHYPDFRAYERAFELLTQVSGRAGRKNFVGKVLIQTFETANPLLLNVVQRDYLKMYNRELKERKALNFPPFCRMITILLQHKDKELLNKVSMMYANELRKIFGGRLFGPQEPVIARIKNLYGMELQLKIEKNISYKTTKQKIKELNETFASRTDNSGLRININVDPV